MTLRFDQPWFLLLALLAVPLLLLGWRALAMTDAVRRAIALGLRAVLLLVVAFILAGPSMQRQHHHLTVIGLLDISGSVRRFADLPELLEDQTVNASTQTLSPDTSPSARDSNVASSPSPIVTRSNLDYLRTWFRQATQLKEPDDRFGLVVFDGQAVAISAPTRSNYVDDNIDMAMQPGTNIEGAVRLGLAMFPADTAKRFVLVTDGNQTAGDVMEAMKQAGANNSGLSILDFGLRDETGGNTAQSRTQNPKSKIAQIPIDVLPIAYHVTSDVQVARIEAPPSALPGQTVTVRIILEAASPTTGFLSLRREGIPVDLNGASTGTSRYVQLPAGQSVQLAQVSLGQTPINRFEALFEAENPAADLLPDNDRAEAFTATPSKGAVLVLDRNAGSGASNLLADLLNAADLPAIAQSPSSLPEDLLSLQNYDLIILNDVAAYDLNSRQQERLISYVNDLGGGLIMIGGENSFGAAGWNGTDLEAMLPLELDPKRELRLPTAALVLVLDKSGSMNQGVAGARASQQEVANEGAALAIESLRADSLVGVITFDSFAHTVVPLQANEDPRKIADRVRNITAEGGTNIEPALRRAYDMLKDVEVAKKRVVCLSDGRTQSEELEAIARRMAAANIQITTIAVGDDADHDMLHKLSAIGGGEFYSVRDPRMLPRVLIDSVKIINRPLIKEVTFTPQVLATGSTLTTGMNSAPALDGLVITSAREDPKVWLEMLGPDGDPLLAHWQAGLGRVATFTSDFGGAWSKRWIDWPSAGAFWIQLARTIARPAMSQDAELIATVRDDRLDIAFEMLETLDEGGQPSAAGDQLESMQVAGVVYRPDGTSIPVRLRQTAPGRYESSVEAQLAGNYIVALNPRQGSRLLAPVIGGTSRSTSPEFRRYQSNIGLLQEIAQLTGGRWLDVANPLSADLFDRTGMPPSISLLPIWRTLLWWVIALLLLDVACRRIAWDYNMVRNFVRSAVQRVTPSYVRGAEATATLATLRKVSDEVDARREVAAAGLQRLQGTGRIMPPPDRNIETPEFVTNEKAAAVAAASESEQDMAAKRARAADADKKRFAAALDAFLGRSSVDDKSTPPVDAAAKPDPTASSAETTSNLLAAKRRARQKLQGETDEK